MCSVLLLEFYVRGRIAQADHPAIALSTSEGEGAAPLEPALPPLQPLRPREVLRGMGRGGRGGGLPGEGEGDFTKPKLHRSRTKPKPHRAESNPNRRQTIPNRTETKPNSTSKKEGTAAFESALPILAKKLHGQGH